MCTAVQRVLGRCDRSFPKSYYKYCIYLRRYSTAVIKDILKLNERGIFKTITPEGRLEELKITYNSIKSKRKKYIKRVVKFFSFYFCNIW